MNTKRYLASSRQLIGLMAIGSALLLGACAVPVTPNAAGGGAAAPTARPPATATPAATAGAIPSGVSETTLKNAEYRLPDLGSFRLADGQFEYKYGSGATQLNRVTFTQAVSGDLNGDGTTDAAVILAANTGGTGTFIYVAAMVDRNGQPQQAAVELLGDRVQIVKLAIKDGQVVVDAKGFSAGDPMCCPSLSVTRTYRLEGQSLAVVSEVQATPPAAPTAQPQAGPDAALAQVRFDPATKKCSNEPARTLTDQTWQYNAVEEGGYGVAAARPGQKVTIQLRNKLGAADAQYQALVTVIAADGSSKSASAAFKGNELLGLAYPQAFAGAAATTPGVYTVIYQVNSGFVACWGFEVK